MTYVHYQTYFLLNSYFSIFVILLINVLKSFMYKIKVLSTSFLLACGYAYGQNGSPNVLIILADDIGYGDLSPYFPNDGYSTLKTPNVEKLSKNGVVFTNAHSTSSMSTPSRYSILTGLYPWRRNDTGIADGDAALIINPKKEYTIANLFKDNGYRTAVVGKWHLGLGDKSGKQDWNGYIPIGPDKIGFDYSYIMAATADRTPCVFLENQKVVDLDMQDPIEVNYHKNFDGEPTGKNNPELLTKQKPSHGHDQSIINGISRIGYMKGGKKALWVDENIADSINEKSFQFIKKSVRDNKPFFLMMCTNDIHVPRMPHKRFQGLSKMGYRGDAILQFDNSVGYIVEKLDSMGCLDNTIIVLTSDNGPVLDDGYVDEAVSKNRNHKPWGPFRGGKYSAYEAGTRIPFIISGKSLPLKKGTRNDALVCQMDLVRSFASLLGFDYKFDNDAKDVSDALFSSGKKGRDYLVEGSYTLSLITSDGWKYIMPKVGKTYWETTNTEIGLSEKDQLYNLNNDPNEYFNVADTNPDILQKMKKIISLEKELFKNKY